MERRDLQSGNQCPLAVPLAGHGHGHNDGHGRRRVAGEVERVPGQSEGRFKPPDVFRPF
jgi:hypothetical protein